MTNLPIETLKRQKTASVIAFRLKNLKNTMDILPPELETVKKPESKFEGKKVPPEAIEWAKHRINAAKDIIDTPKCFKQVPDDHFKLPSEMEG